MKDLEKVGQDKPMKDPADLLKKQQGTYKDNAEGVKQDYMPKAPDPSPFTSRG